MMKSSLIFALVLLVPVNAWWGKSEAEEETESKIIQMEARLSTLESKVTNLEIGSSVPGEGTNDLNNERTLEKMKALGWLSTTTQKPHVQCLLDPLKWLCYDADQCIDKTMLCNGVFDCRDQSDEKYCDNEDYLLTPHDVCPTGWLASPGVGKCYYFSPIDEKKVSWLGAYQSCLKKGGDLVAIESRAEQEVIQRQVAEIGERTLWWLGATNMNRQDLTSATSRGANSNVDELWSWTVTGNTFSGAYTNWILRPPQPDDIVPNTENCMEMRHDWQWRWNDQKCHEQKNYICEFRPRGAAN